ncbi:MAG: glycosyltransferase family 2 protein [Patescibacteria group bacterium]
MNLFSKTYHKYLNTLIKNIIPRDQIKNYIVFKNSLAYSQDIQKEITKTYNKCKPETRVLVIYFNFFWKPILDLAEKLSLKKKNTNKEPNWLSPDDINNIFELESFEKIKSGKMLIFPFPGKFFGVLNKFLSLIPIIKELGLITYQIYRPIIIGDDYSVSVIIPARNESGNIKGVLSKLPKFKKGLEVIFVEGHSKDNTYQTILDEIKNNKRRDTQTFVYKQKGVGKNDAVKLGFSKARNELLMILDADLTVKPSELLKFYEVIAKNKAELVIGSRLIYPMEKQAMRLLNYFGNKIFSIIFSFIIEQRVKDTLCGTKSLLRKNYEIIKRNQRYFGNFDPFGDFDLIFGAAKQNFKIVEIPVRYKERRYGSTNIDRFRHGLLLIKMSLIGLQKLKFR